MTSAVLGGQYDGWRCAEFERILTAGGYLEVSRKGSHRTWKHAKDPKLFTFRDAGHGPVSPGYVRLLAKRIHAIREGL